MSTPPDQPSAYPYPGPQSQGGYGTPPSPGQQAYPGPNPYAQPTQAGAQPVAHNPYAQPAGYGTGAVQPYPGDLPGPPTAPGGGAGGGGGRGGGKVLAALVGAVVASALWAGGVFGLPLVRGDDEADLGAYTVKDDLCQSADISSLKESYPEEDTEPRHDKVETSALDSMTCNLSLKTASDEYAQAYLSINVDLHEETDPSAEFDALWQGYSQREGGYEVAELDGFGDQAYLVTAEPTEDSSGAYVYLAVRDGWMTYYMSWSDYSFGSDTSGRPTVADVTEKLKTDTKATLEKLQS